MKFTPKSEEELGGDRVVFPAGDYEAMVYKASEETSKSGNDMIKLQLEIFDPKGGPSAFVFDYLVATEKALFKIRHFCDSAGMLDLYESGSLYADACIDANVMVKLVVEKYEGDDQNKVKDYIKRPTPQSQPVTREPDWEQAKKSVPDDDIPF